VTVPDKLSEKNDVPIKLQNIHISPKIIIFKWENVYGEKQ